MDLLYTIGLTLGFALCCALPLLWIGFWIAIDNRLAKNDLPSEKLIRQQIAKYEASARKGDLVAYEHWKYWVELLDERL